MTVIDKLATSLNRKDEAPNQELAQRIVKDSDKKAIKELADNLANENKGIQSDCIKVLYEIGEQHPNLIAQYHKEFGKLLDSKNNRLAWGAMTALDTIALEEPKSVYKILSKIIEAADSGSVITRDHAVGILIKLASMKVYSKACLPMLIEQLIKSPNNQFPMYIEMAETLINSDNKHKFEKVIKQRVEGLEKESQKRRVTKILKRVNR